MNKVILILILGLNFCSHAQINRAYGSLGVGTKLIPDFSVYIHAYNHFSIGLSHNFRRYRTGPPASQYGGILFAKYVWLKDYRDYTSVFVGFTTNARNKNPNVSLVFGPSFAQYVIRTDIEIKTNVSGNEYHTYNSYSINKVGACGRIDLSIPFTKHFGVNCALEGNTNSHTSYLRFIIGFNIGLVSNSKSQNDVENQ